jgi:sugar/nucleoside kinase (ribokinase family)
MPMSSLMNFEPIDYLVIGHITQDVTQGGFRLGGTVSYSSLTARALGLRVGIVTACSDDAILDELDGIQIIAHKSQKSSTFEIIHTAGGRILNLLHRADSITPDMIPPVWRNTPIVHFAPVIQEIPASILGVFPQSYIGLTLQGWLRNANGNGRIQYCDWLDEPAFLSRSQAAVLSIEDVGRNESRIEEMLPHSNVLVVTEGAQGSRLYWNRDERYFRPPATLEVDPVGAGDIFAAAFFHRHHQTRNPWEAARFATLLAARSVTRLGLKGTPSVQEALQAGTEIIQD